MNTETKDMPSVSRGEAFLSSGDMVKNPVQVFEKYRKAWGDTFSFYFGGLKKTIVTTDPNFIQHVLKDNQANYNKSDIQVERMAEFQGVGLLNSHGEPWLRQRRLLSKGFSHSHLAKLLPLQAEALAEFMEAFQKKLKKGPIDIHHEMVNFTLRFVGKALFGKNMKEESIERLGDAILEVQTFMVKQIMKPFLIPWYKISGETKKYQKIREKTDQMVMEYVEQRRKEGSDDGDMLQILLETKYSDTGELMSDEQVKIEIIQLLVAGNETSSNVLSWTFYLLAKHPDHLQKVRDEINGVFGAGDITYEGLRKLKYTVCVLNEAMRLYPPFWMIDREAVNDDEVCGYKIKAGTIIAVYIYGVHRNTDLWKNPETFDPERFTDESQVGRHDYAHVPFGGGPRICIGQNMAMMQILLVLISIVKKYNFQLTPNQNIDIHPMMILRPSAPIMLQFDAIA